MAYWKNDKSYLVCSKCSEYYRPMNCDVSFNALERMIEGDVYSYCPFCGAKIDKELTAKNAQRKIDRMQKEVPSLNRRAEIISY